MGEHGGSMTRQRRILGMTTTQIGILVALGAAACILFAITGWLVMGGGIRLAPASTPVPQITSTPFVMPTVTATLSPTPVPYEQLIPEGWKQHKTELVEIWLPSNFKSGGKDADEELALRATNPKSSLYAMSVTVFYEPLGTYSLDSYIDNQLVKIDPTIRVVEHRKVSLNGIDAVRMVFEARVQSTDVNELVYVIQDGDTAWAVLYVAQINEFYEMLPTFEQSAKTFRIVQ
jgi:hypothetical protein